jgi:hypothetical protein
MSGADQGVPCGATDQQVDGAPYEHPTVIAADRCGDRRRTDTACDTGDCRSQPTRRLSITTS